MRKTSERDTAQPGPEMEQPGPEQTAAESDPFSLDNLRKAQNFDQMIEVEQVLTHVPVRKPSKHEFFRVRDGAEWTLDVHLLEDKTDRKFYLVNPALVPYLLGRTEHVRLVVCIVHRSNQLLLWPLKLPDESGRANAWHQTALEAADWAKGKWVQVVANMSKSANDVNVAKGQLPEPKWPDYTFAEILAVAFRGMQVKDMEHPLMQRLEGLI